MSSRKIKCFITVLSTFLIVAFIGVTTANAKAEAEGISPVDESSTPILKTATTIGTQEGTPDNSEVTVEDTGEIAETTVCPTDNEKGCVSKETATPVATGTPEYTATSIASEPFVVTSSSQVTETQTNALTTTETDTATPTPTQARDTTPPVIKFSTVNAADGSITFQISITDDFGIGSGSFSGQASEVNGSTQNCNFSDDGKQITCTLVLDNGNYHIQVSAADKAGNVASEDLPDFTVQISDVN